jgi:hypothetical protein
MVKIGKERPLRWRPFPIALVCSGSLVFLIDVLVLNNSLLEHGSNRLAESDITLQDEVAHWLLRTTAKRGDMKVFVILKRLRREVIVRDATTRAIDHYLAHRMPRFFVRCHDRKSVEQRRNYPLRLFGPVVP